MSVVFRPDSPGGLWTSPLHLVHSPNPGPGGGQSTLGLCWLPQGWPDNWRAFGYNLSPCGRTAGFAQQAVGGAFGFALLNDTAEYPRPAGIAPGQGAFQANAAVNAGAWRRLTAVVGPSGDPSQPTTVALFRTGSTSPIATSALSALRIFCMNRSLPLILCREATRSRLSQRLIVKPPLPNLLPPPPQPPSRLTCPSGSSRRSSSAAASLTPARLSSGPSPTSPSTAAP